MNSTIHYQPNYALLNVALEAGEQVISEGGAMVTRSTNVAIKTAAGKGGFKRMLLGGESFFRNTFTAEGGAGEVTFAPSLAGDIAETVLEPGRTVYLQSKSFLASATSVELDTKWGGAKSFFAGEGLFLLKATGAGPLWFNAFGAIHEITLDGDLIVDTGHLVAFDDTVEYTVRKFGGGWKSFLLGGEGLVAEMTGTGRVWIQTRNPGDYGSWLGRKLPMREN